MSSSGFLVIADISGYTGFLTGSELDHAQGVLEDLFETILGRLTSPLSLSNVQGDAFFSYSNDVAAWSPGEVLDTIEALYFDFRTRLTSIIDNTTCSCRACRNVRKLDLKFIVHHGEYVINEIAGRRELTGVDVILLHRLLKNEVVDRTGISSYGLFTPAAVKAFDLAELREETVPYQADLEEFGCLECAVLDFGARWDRQYATHEIVVPEENNWIPPISVTIPASVEAVWAVYWHPKYRSTWNKAIKEMTRVSGDTNRLRVGAVDHCAHGKDVAFFHYVDVRPLKHVTLDVILPMNGYLRSTVSFSKTREGTVLTARWQKPQGGNILSTLFFRLTGVLVYRRQVQKQFTEAFANLAILVTNQRSSNAPPERPLSLSAEEIRTTAREMVAHS